MKAGLFPKLRERGLRPVYARTLQDPLGDLLAALAAEAGVPAPPAATPTDDALRTLIGKLPSTGRVVLVLDQFEEFFIRFRHRSDRRDAFVAALRSLVLDPVLDIHVVFSVREDYLAELDDFKRALPGLFDRAHRLLPLTAFGAREAITRPLIARGIPFSPTLITKLVDELEKVGFEPPLLQIVCTEVYRRAVLRDPSALALNEEDLQRVGDLQDIFRRYLDALTREMSIARDSLLARNVFDALLTREGTKRAVTLADLTNAQFRASEAEVAEVLDVLVRRYVVRREIRNDVPWFELIHENVVESVKAWLDLDPDFVKFRSTRDLVVSVSRIGRSDGRFDVLLNKGQIEGMVGQFRSRFRFDKMQAAYVFLSAVKSGSDHAGYWADQMGPDVGVSMLLEALDDRRPESREIRLGAATVAGVMTDPFGRIARALAGFSREPDEELRRAAARSYRHLVERYGTPRAPASPPPPSQETPAPAGSGLGAWTQRTFQLEASPTYRAVLGLIRAVREGRPLEALRAASESVRAGNPEHDFLATRAEEGDPLLDQPFFERRLARRAAEVRIRRTHAKAVHDHAAQGALAGLAAGLVWTFTVGLAPFLLAVVPGTLPNHETSRFFAWYSLLFLVAFGFFGYATTAADAIESLIRGDGFRPLRMARSRLLLAVFCAFALSAADYWTGLFPGWTSTRPYPVSYEFSALLFLNLFVVSTLPTSRGWGTRLAVSLTLLVLSSLTSLAALSAEFKRHGSGGYSLDRLPPEVSSVRRRRPRDASPFVPGGRGPDARHRTLHRPPPRDAPAGRVAVVPLALPGGRGLPRSSWPP